MSADPETDMGQSIEELGHHTVDPHPDLGGRVRRDINRRTLTADGLELSLSVMLSTVWEYVQTFMEILPGAQNQDEEDGNG